jgi:hypothetical protein
MKYIKFILLFLIMGCAPKYSNLGWEYFYKQDFNNSKYFFSAGLEKDSLDYDAIKGLGLSYLMLNNHESAEYYMNKAYRMNSNDPENTFSMGLFYSITNSPEKSISYLQKFMENSANEELKAEADKILISERKKLYQTELKSALENESKITLKDISGNSIAVLPFKNTGEHGDYDVLEKGLAEQTITYLGYVNKLKVLERLRIEELTKEINLSQSEIIDKSTAIRAGKLLRAEKLLAGNFNISKDKQLTINMYSVSVPDGTISDETSGNGYFENFFEVHKETLLRTLEKLKVSVNDETRKKILTFKTENILEFISYLKKKYAEESEGVIVSNWMTNRLNILNSSPVLDIINISQIAVKPDVKATIIPLESPDLEAPPTLPK